MQHSARTTTVVDGVTLSAASVGAGPPVVYLHGALTTLEEGLLALGPILAPHHRLIAFDRPGHGASGTGPGAGSAWRQAALIRAAVVEMGVSRPVIVGHSFGGAVATAYALQFPDEIAGVVALAPIAFPEPRLEQMMFGLRAIPGGGGDWLNAIAAPWDGVAMPLLWDGMFLPQAMPENFRSEFPFALSLRPSQLRADGEEALAMGVDLARSASAYAFARVQLRVLQGDRDAVVNPLRHGRPLAFLWPDSAFVSLTGLGHMAHHFAPERVLEAIADCGDAGAAVNSLPRAA